MKTVHSAELTKANDTEILSTILDEIAGWCDTAQDAEDREDYAAAGVAKARVRALRAEMAAMVADGGAK